MTITPGFYPVEYFVPADPDVPAYLYSFADGYEAGRDFRENADAVGDDIGIEEHAFADGHDAGTGFRENAANELAEWHADTLKQAIKDGQLNAWLDGFATSARER